MHILKPKTKKSFNLFVLNLVMQNWTKPILQQVRLSFKKHISECTFFVHNYAWYLAILLIW